jgi:hypothetical protein
MFFFFTGTIVHAPRIILWTFTGTGVIAPVSWQALKLGYHGNFLYILVLDPSFYDMFHHEHNGVVTRLAGLTQYIGVDVYWWQVYFDNDSWKCPINNHISIYLGRGTLFQFGTSLPPPYEIQNRRKLVMWPFIGKGLPLFWWLIMCLLELLLFMVTVHKGLTGQIVSFLTSCHLIYPVCWWLGLMIS